MALRLLWLGLLSYVLMEVTKTPVEEGLCTAVPCRLEFPTESRVNSTVTGYWINKNISSPTAPNQPSATRDDDTNGRFHIIWNLEERDCISLIHRVPESDNVTASAELGEQKSALLRENIPVPMSDLTQKPELYIPEILVAGEPVTLTCTIRGSCIETKALFLSWKGPAVSFNTDGSSRSSSSSSVLHFAPKPEDYGTTLHCRLNFSLPDLTRSNMATLQVMLPTTLLHSSCSLEKTLQCSCSFYGIPTPTVQWLMKGVPISVNSMDNILQVTSTITAPWANSTVTLTGDPEIVMSLHCEGRNLYGIHTSSIFLIPDKNSVSRVFMKGLVQGMVYGSIASALFCFFLDLLAMKLLKWWEKSQIPKDKEALILRKPELLKEPKTSKETKAETSPVSAGV